MGAWADALATDIIAVYEGKLEPEALQARYGAVTEAPPALAAEARAAAAARTPSEIARPHRSDAEQSIGGQRGIGGHSHGAGCEGHDHGPDAQRKALLKQLQAVRAQRERAERGLDRNERGRRAAPRRTGALRPGARRRTRARRAFQAPRAGHRARHPRARVPARARACGTRALSATTSGAPQRSRQGCLRPRRFKSLRAVHSAGRSAAQDMKSPPTTTIIRRCNSLLPAKTPSPHAGATNAPGRRQCGGTSASRSSPDPPPAKRPSSGP